MARIPWESSPRLLSSQENLSIPAVAPVSTRGASKPRNQREPKEQSDVSAANPDGYLLERLAGLDWPAAFHFPVNHTGTRVRETVWRDLSTSADPLVVAGFSSIAELVDLIAAWERQSATGQARVLLGSEPFASARSSFASTDVAFTDEVRRYWLEEGISLRLSAKVLQVIQALDNSRLLVRSIGGPPRLHAKIFVGSNAATLGSSNFTAAGLSSQIEANSRFDRRTDTRRYYEVTQVAENYWSVGTPWDDQLRALLGDLLQFVPWQEALAKACSDLLDGAWAQKYLSSNALGSRLWPSQISGIAQALWIVENVGSVLVADATGSGKTRMGAHLVRAVRDRLWSTGRVRRDLTVLVCPPSVESTWYREAVSCGVTINTVSHGLLSRQGDDGPRAQELAVKNAEILAIDEGHNFLSADSNRTRQVRESLAEHVLLFTATPISKGTNDLLQLVGLLGADNFEDETLDILEQLERRRGLSSELSVQQQEQLRNEIQRFTVRRTKPMLNAVVDEDPEAYRHPITGRICRYPQHEAITYETGETRKDEAIAARVREAAAQLKGVALIGRQLVLPPGLAHEYSDERFLDYRLAAARGLAGHHVLTALRSSKAALVEHVAGTDEAITRCSIPTSFKPKPTGNMLSAIERLVDQGPPKILLRCEVPSWLKENKAWREVCEQEIKRYSTILDATDNLSAAREQAKANLLLRLVRRHPRVIAFDHHLITLSVIQPLLNKGEIPVIVATGFNKRNRKEVQRVFAPDSNAVAIALCSDAMNEGLNLQGAAAMVHFDIPTTLRVAEQRVGRVDRMDNRNDAIEVHWPRDGAAFATRANELLAARALESSLLLGANLTVPNLKNGADEIVDVNEHIAILEAARTETWDGIHDALEPVRRLVDGSAALISPRVYEEHRHTRSRVLARISPVTSTDPWVFFAVSGVSHGAPRWIMLEGEDATPIVGLQHIVGPLRKKLRDDPPGLPYDSACDLWLNRYITVAARMEVRLLPRRMQRALEQMTLVTENWSSQAARRGDHETSTRWKKVGSLASPSDAPPP